METSDTVLWIVHDRQDVMNRRPVAAVCGNVQVGDASLLRAVVRIIQVVF